MSIDRARDLRSNPTEAEKRLWSAIRQRQIAGLRFRHQMPIGHWIVDFACPSHRLIVEVDGGQHAGSSRDARRDGYLAARGWRVLRFWNNEVLDNLEGVVRAVVEAAQEFDGLTKAPTQPSPARGEGQ